jgi:hypothetical protein
MNHDCRNTVLVPEYEHILFAIDIKIKLAVILTMCAITSSDFLRQVYLVEITD